MENKGRIVPVLRGSDFCKFWAIEEKQPQNADTRPRELRWSVTRRVSFFTEAPRAKSK